MNAISSAETKIGSKSELEVTVLQYCKRFDVLDCSNKKEKYV
jgi:hypothetical protein